MSESLPRNLTVPPMNLQGSGKYKYGEYQYVCNATQILAKDCFSNVDEYQGPNQIENFFGMKDTLQFHL